MSFATSTLPSSQNLVHRAIARDKDALRTLLNEVTPVIRARVTRAVSASRSLRTQRRSSAQEVEDMAQEVFVALFADDARTLRAWDPARGASLKTFVGLVAEHQVYAILRSGRQRPWRDDEASDAELAQIATGRKSDPELRVASRELFSRLFEQLRSELTPRGLELFEALLVDEQPIAEVCRRTGMTTEAVYAWRSRLRRLVQKLASDIEQERRAEPQVSTLSQ